MSYSFDWRCNACEKPNQHDFPVKPFKKTVGSETMGTDGKAGRIMDRTLECTSCSYQQPMATGAFDVANNLLDPISVCLACGSNRLYTQKDFNRKLGVAIVIVGAALSPWTYGLSLVVCMGLDYGLYSFVPEIVVCYACDAIHRRFEHNPTHRAHDPLLAERFRREARQELKLEVPETEDDNNKN